MAATRTTLKQYFKKYATPTEEQFAALIDAFVHKDEDSLTQSKIDGLTAALESKVSSSDLASAVATAVVETLQGGNIEVTPAAHQHAIADVEDLQAFVTKVNNFLESADVSDETINRWVEIETFLTGITDQETLTGLLLNLKNEILAQIPEPQTGNYLKQISDLDAYTEAQEGEIVQYVGTSTADYTRGFCYERVAGETLVEGDPIEWNNESLSRYTFDGDSYVTTFQVNKSKAEGFGTRAGDNNNNICAFFVNNEHALIPGLKTSPNDDYNYFPYGFENAEQHEVEIVEDNYGGLNATINGVKLNGGSATAQVVIRERDNRAFILINGSSYQKRWYLLTPAYIGNIADPTSEETRYYYEEGTTNISITTGTISVTPLYKSQQPTAAWQPIATSPVVS